MPQSATDLLGSLEHRPTIESAFLFDSDGKLFAAYQRDAKSDFSPKPPDWEGHRFRPGGYVDVAHPVLEEGHAIGALSLHVSMRDVHQQLYRSALIALMVMLLSLGVAVVFSARLQRVISTPILDLTTAAERIAAAGDYSIRVEPQSKDEIGTLYRQFNLMLWRIQTGEEELRRLTVILETTSDLVSMATPDGQLTYMNRAGRRLVGFGDNEELAGKTISDVHPEWAFRIVQSKGIPGAIANGTWEAETAIVGPDGAEVPVSQVVMSHKSPGGEIEYLSTIMRDMTERKQAEEEMKRLRNFLKNMIDSMPSALLGVDMDGRVTQAYRLQPSLKFLIHTGSSGYHIPAPLTEIGIGHGDLFRKPLPDMSVIVEAVYRRVHGKDTRDED